MFITDEDYKVVIGDQALKVVSQVSQENRANAETEAMEEIAGYLRPKYNTEAVFSAAGTDRNRLVVMYTCDIAIYHMAASTPQKMGMEIRKERYERAVKWLEGVQAGKIVPDLPLAMDEYGEPIGIPMVYGCQKKLKHNW
nr:MAG TPA: head to tail adaptor [Caudoviricetes sp.]